MKGVINLRVPPNRQGVLEVDCDWVDGYGTLLEVYNTDSLATVLSYLLTIQGHKVTTQDGWDVVRILVED